jgi:hypothetical protein
MVALRYGAPNCAAGLPNATATGSNSTFIAMTLSAVRSASGIGLPLFPSSAVVSASERPRCGWNGAPVNSFARSAAPVPSPEAGQRAAIGGFLRVAAGRGSFKTSGNQYSAADCVVSPQIAFNHRAALDRKSVGIT